MHRVSINGDFSWEKIGLIILKTIFQVFELNEFLIPTDYFFPFLNFFSLQFITKTFNFLSKLYKFLK